MLSLERNHARRGCPAGSVHRGCVIQLHITALFELSPDGGTDHSAWPAIKMRCLLMLMTPARSPLVAVRFQQRVFFRRFEVISHISDTISLRVISGFQPSFSCAWSGRRAAFQLLPDGSNAGQRDNHIARFNARRVMPGDGNHMPFSSTPVPSKRSLMPSCAAPFPRTDARSTERRSR